MSAFNAVIEDFDELKINEKKEVLGILKRRYIEERRLKLFKSLKIAEKEYVNGNIKKGNVNDLLRDLND
ncbi:MAG TPA: hypothetical protein PLG34_12340 [Spirochaetota bacterium]|jgi:hypothetical protein|nr:MAG: hypothetical protein BWX91_02351 [Spirochaetes bacterium ADurb.Bin133]HNZ27385.1 hypothetical protein [Spirochaetota bacterium]HPY88759.1 hypothetical protein [Spirochaetota bacterium]